MRAGSSPVIPPRPQPRHPSARTDDALALIKRAKRKLLREIHARRRYLGRVFRPNIWTVEPVSREFGFDRGQPVDRFYIDRFMEREAAAIRGAVLEIENRIYTRRFGGSRVTSSDVLYRFEGDPRATMAGDLADAPHVAADRFDCIILMHTLQYIFDAPAALRTCWRILKPGGTLLVVVPFISQYSVKDRSLFGEYWRFSRMALGRMLAADFGDNVRVDGYGNALAASAFLHGVAARELSLRELNHDDPDYDLIVTGVARKSD